MGDAQLRRNGFTLLESVIVISLLGLVGLSFAYLYTTAQRFMIQSINFSYSQGDASFALEHIRRHVAPATAIAVPAVGGSGNVLRFTWQPTAIQTSRISQYDIVNVTDLRYTPDIAAPGVYEEPNGVIAKGIRSIAFTRTTAGTVSIDVTARRTGGSDTRETRLQTNVSPRGVFQ